MGDKFFLCQNPPCSSECRTGFTMKPVKKYKNSYIIAFILLTTSCATAPLDLSLDFNARLENPVQSNIGVLGVDEFIDLRPQAATSDAKKWLGFIPGVLWIEFFSEIPDVYTAFSAYNSNPFKSAFARAIHTNLEQNKIFEKTVFLPRDKYAKIDYRLEGILNRTFIKETGYYYGSGFYAWLTRIFGLPYVSYECIVDITLRLRNMATNEIVWTYELKGTRADKYYNIYQLANGNEGKNVLSYNFSKILEKEMPAVLQSMVDKIKQ